MIWYRMSSEQSTQFANGNLELDEDFYGGAESLVTDTKFVIEQKVC